MKRLLQPIIPALALLWVLSAAASCHADESPAAADILGNAKYPAICYGGYRQTTRDVVPTVAQIKEDLKILSAMGIRIVRTYNTQEFPFASRVLDAIAELRTEQPEFEMYVMLGAWINCKGAWSDNVDHGGEDADANEAEISAAVTLAKKHPEIVRVIAVGNEAMVHWAASYFVRPTVILKWVNHLQELKTSGQLSSKIFITTSDNFASWGGGDDSYHRDDLTQLLKAVDYVSVHVYPFHDTHYNSAFWLEGDRSTQSSAAQAAEAAVGRAVEYAKGQYNDTVKYIRGLGIDKPIHIGETGWASSANHLYGRGGSGAADELKAKLYHDAIRRWTNAAGISCFFFEAFDEPWKDGNNPGGSENHFGLINLKGQAKYVLWPLVDKGVFAGLTRDGRPITKTFGGDKEALLKSVLPIPGGGGKQ